MRRFIFLITASALVNVSVSLMVAGLLLVWQRGFGSGDIVAFFFWTLPLAVAVAAIGPVVLHFFERVPARVRWLLLVGATLLGAFGWLYGVAGTLGLWIRTFSFSLIYPWLAGVAAQLFFQDRFLFHSREKVVGRRYLLVVPGALLILVGGFWLKAYLNKPVPETYLIPATFRGGIRIVYGEEGGISPPIENGRRVLQIPPDGILIIQPEFKSGLMDNEFFLVDEAGGKERLDGTQMAATAPSNRRPSVRTGGVSGLAGEMPDGSYSSDSPLAITYAIYTVYDSATTAETETELLRRQEPLDSLMLVRIERSRLPK